MTKSLADIMANKWDEPKEFIVIKEYVRQKYNAQVGIKQTDRSIIILTSGSALAGTLRMDINKLQEELNTDKKLLIRVGWN
jgi:hypothetical protein